MHIFNNVKDSLLFFNKIANFSGHNRGWWICMFVENTSNKKQEIVIQIRNNYINSASFYRVSNDIELFGLTGIMVPLSKRTSHERFMNGKLTIQPNKTEQILIEIKKNNLVKLPVKIFQSHLFDRLNSVEHLLYGIYFGVILIIFMYTISLAISIRNRMLFEYAIYLLVFGFSVFCVSGFIHRFLITNGNSYIEYIYQDSILLLLLSMTFFGISFLNLKTHFPKYTLYLKWLMGAYVFWYLGLKILGFLNLLTNNISLYYPFQQVFIILFFASLFLAGILNIKNNKKISNLYLLANGSLLVGMVFSIVLELVVTSRKDINADFSLVYEGAYMSGSILEIMFFTIGVSIFVRDINYKKLSLQNKLIEEKFENNLKIEKLKSIVIKDYIVLKDKAKVYVSSLMYIKSEDHYLNIFLNEGKNHFVRGKLNQIKEELPPNFIQCHRSYIVNSNFIKQINSTTITLINNERIPLSRSYKKKF